MDSNTDVGYWYDAANIVIIINLSNIFIAKNELLDEWDHNGY